MPKPKPPNLNLDSSTQNCQNTFNFTNFESTFRHDGISIGGDYLRVEGKTLTRGELLPENIQCLECIGKGAFSTVHRAYCNNKQYVAVKNLSIHHDYNNCIMMWQQTSEIKMLAQVDCPALVKLLGAFVAQHTITLVLEYMDRGSLCDFISKYNNNNINKQAFLPSMVYQMIYGLAYLHSKRILHRDLKPANVLLHSSGHVKLADFGLATLLPQDSSLHTTVLGTSKYMAPERLRNRPYGRASDIWSLGLIVLECVTGEPPWKDVTSLVDLVVTVEESRVETVVDVVQEVLLREMMMGCLQHEPARRMPAMVLLRSPWFAQYGISDLEAAIEQTRELLSDLESPVATLE